MRTTEEIIRMIEREKNFVRINPHRITVYKMSRGKIRYAKKYIRREQYDSVINELARKPTFHSRWYDKDLPKGLQKVELNPIKLKYQYKLLSTREKYESVFLAYTRDQARSFNKLIDKRLIPMQMKDYRPKTVIDLSKKFKKQRIIEEKRLKRT